VRTRNHWRGCAQARDQHDRQRRARKAGDSQVSAAGAWRHGVGSRTAIGASACIYAPWGYHVQHG
jgi:hypothetical protein